VALVLIMLYVLSVIYTFRSGRGAAHSHAQQEPGAPGEDGADAVARDAAPVHRARWTLRFSILMLVLATVGTALVSETLVGAVEPVTQQLGLTEFFLGIIIIPLVGNVAEHLVAVQVALRNKMELSLAVSLGSSLQVALLVAPLLVFISLLLGQRLLLVFNTFELVTLIGAAVIAAFVAQDGESNWLEGAMLLAVYLIVALAFFFLAPGVMPHSSP
jgi:Ca2+:H+ antiporter